MDDKKLLWYSISFSSEDILDGAVSEMKDIINKISTYQSGGFKIYRAGLSLYFHVEDFGVLLSIKKKYKEIGIIGQPIDLLECKVIWPPD